MHLRITDGRTSSRSHTSIHHFAVAALVSALLGCMACAALPSRADALEYGMQDGLAISPNPTLQANAIAEMQTLGVRVARVTLSWRGVATGASCARATLAELAKPDSSCYNWTVYDRLVTLARQHRMVVMASIWQSPEWSNGHHGYGYTASTDRAFSSFAWRYAMFAKAAATRYRRGSTHGTINLWTIWNEPNSGRFWQPMNRFSTPRRYALLFARAARQIRSVNAAAKIAAGPTGPNSVGIKPGAFIRSTQPYLRRYLGSHARVFLNAWAHNPYPGAPASPTQKIFRYPAIGIGNFSDLVHTLDSNAVTRRLPIWVTEFAYETRPADRTFGASESAQAIWMAQTFRMMWSARRVPFFIWYIMKDPAAVNDWQSGVIATNGRHKPAYAMYQHPVSASSLRIRRGGSVTLWGRNNASRAPARLQWSLNGRVWHTMGHTRHVRGAVVRTLRPAATMYFRSTGGGHAGPRIKVRVTR